MAEKDFKVRKGLVVPDGSVGIGTASPVSELDLNTGALSFATTNSQLKLSGGSNVDLQLGHWGNTHILIDTDNNDSNRYFAVSHGNATAGSATELMRVQENGNVGIGETNPQSTFHLSSGSGYLKMDTSGSDATIKSDYRLTLHADPEAANSSGYRNIWFYTGNVKRAAFTDDGIFHTYSSMVAQDLRPSAITGTIDPAASTTVTGVGTRFKQELKVGDGLLVTGETRYVTAIASDTSLTVNTAFSDNANDTTPEKIPTIFSALKSDDSLAMIIDSTGGVGMGTIPAFTSGSGLHIKNSTQANVRLEDDAGEYFDVAMQQGNAYLINRVSDGFISLRTNSTERMKILSGGNVGIGATTPSALLHLKGGSSEAMPLRLERPTAGGANYGVGLEFVMGETGDASAERVYGELSMAMDGVNGNAAGGSAHDGYFAIRPSLNGTPTERMRVLSGGNVGIGITSPSILLDVNGVSGYGGALDTTDAGSATAVFVESKGIRLGKDSAGGQSAPIEFMASHWGLGYGWKIQNKDTSGGTDLLFYSRRSVTSWDEEFRITDDGKVGIGGVNPAAKLHVGTTAYEVENGIYLTNSNQRAVQQVIHADDANTNWYAQDIGLALHNTDNTNNNWSPHIVFSTHEDDDDSPSNANPVAVAAISATYNTRVANGWAKGDLVFFTNNAGSGNAERMRITGAGNVGIGNDGSNGFKLEVTGTTKLNGNVTLGSDWIDNVSIIGFSGDGGSPNSILSDGQFGISENSDKFTIWEKGGIGGSGVTTAAFTFDHSGHFTAVSKSFLINHPTKPGMMLRHGSLEGPELAVYVRGSNRGDVIDLPDYWEGLVDEDTITVQLTAKGRSQNLYVKSVNSERIVVGGNKSLDYYYFIQGERKDIDKMVVEE